LLAYWLSMLINCCSLMLIGCWLIVKLVQAGSGAVKLIDDWFMQVDLGLLRLIDVWLMFRLSSTLSILAVRFSQL
jgi:hypothetical protein